MTREQKRATFNELATREGITTGRQFALEYCDPQTPKPKLSIVGEVHLLIEHPFRDKRWMLLRKLPEPQWFILGTTDGQVIALHESQFQSE